jgi:phage terminase large subunit-like protein
MITKYALYQSLGDVRAPRTEEEVEILAHSIRRIGEQAFLAKYIPHKKQRWFHGATSQTKLFIGSNQSGKTTGGLSEILAWCLGYWPNTGEPIRKPDGTIVTPPIRAIVGGEDFTNHHAEVTIPKLQELLPWEFWVEATDKIQGRVVSKVHARNGSTIKLMSYEMDPDKWEGQTADIVLFDEPPPRHAYIGMRRGTMKRGGPILFTMTPLKEPWIYDELYENERTVICESERHFEAIDHDELRRKIFCVQVDLGEVEHLEEEQKEELIMSLDEEEREARQHGRFKHLMGRIYKNFDRGTHVLPSDFPWGRDWPSGVVIDPHDRRPFAVGFFVVSPRDELIFVDEWPEFDYVGCKSWPWAVEQYAEMLREKLSALFSNEPSWLVMDPNFGRSPKATTGTTLVDEFLEFGLYFDTTVDNSLEEGHLRVRRFLDDERLFFLERCPNLIKAMSHYTWDEFKRPGERAPKETPRDKYKDFADVVRYCVMSDPCWQAPDVELSVAAHDSGVRNLGMR